MKKLLLLLLLPALSFANPITFVQFHEKNDTNIPLRIDASASPGTCNPAKQTILPGILSPITKCQYTVRPAPTRFGFRIFNLQGKELGATNVPTNGIIYQLCTAYSLGENVFMRCEKMPAK